MKQVHICSLKEFQWKLRNNEIPMDSFALISSSYPWNIAVPPIKFSFECYDDIDYDCLGRIFSVEAANRFAKAIKENDSVQHWWCVCDGGVRRSAAVAASILRFWDRHEEEFSLIWSNPAKEPNVWVYRAMSNALGVPIDDIDLDLLIHTNRDVIRSALRQKKTTERR